MPFKDGRFVATPDFLTPLLLLSSIAASLFLNSCGGNSPPPPAVATRLSVLAPSVAPVSGTPFNVTVNALDASSSLVASYSGTVHFTSTDSQAVLPADSKLTNGVGTFSLTFKTSGPQTFTVTDPAGVLTPATPPSTTVNPGATAQLSITACPTAVNIGVSFHCTLTAQDASNNVTSGYTGTVHFSSKDTQAVLPANSTLSAGTSSFSASLSSPGPQTITATDTVYPSITGTSTSINVNGPLTISPAVPPNGTVGVNYGITSYRYNLCRYQPFPPNIVCTPCTPGAGGTCGPYPICARYLPTCPCIASIPNPPNFPLVATGGMPPYSWTWAPAPGSSLPPGLNLVRSAISGRPTSPGNFSVVVTVTDSESPAVQKIANYTIKIAPPPVPVANITPLPLRWRMCRIPTLLRRAATHHSPGTKAIPYQAVSCSTRVPERFLARLQQPDLSLSVSPPPTSSS